MIWLQLFRDVGVALSVGACILVAIATAERPCVVSPQAEEKALALLLSWLSPEQAQQYNSQRHFEVVGSDTGTRYRILHGHMANIDQLDATGKKVCRWCVVPTGSLAAGDCMLAQKIALEAFETKVLSISNRLPA
jgi:hypothetical protein